MFTVAQKFSYDFYLASPFFNEEQVEREEFIKQTLRKLGFKVFSPKENCHLEANASQEDRRKIFNDNIDAITNSRAVFAITDGKDMGTIWESGYASALNKPIVYFAETLGKNPFNLMLAQSGVVTITGRECPLLYSYTMMNDMITGEETFPFAGIIE